MMPIWQQTAVQYLLGKMSASRLQSKLAPFKFTYLFLQVLFFFVQDAPLVWLLLEVHYLQKRVPV